MPLIRRVPKRGFTHVRRRPIHIVNVESLNRFESGSVVDPARCLEERLISSLDGIVKILGDGELSHPVTVKAHRFSKTALEKIAKAGGRTESI